MDPTRNRVTQVRVVALGDSLTVGFHSYDILGNVEMLTPYTDVLAERIGKELRRDRLSVDVVNKGVIGELTGQMLARFDIDVIRLSPRIVIILGGSNDLGWGLAPDEVFSNLRGMYDLSLGNRISPIACSVPSILGFDEGIPPRIALNALIREHCEKARLRFVDLFAATMDPSTKRLASRYSSDGLHLNAEGYAKLGNAIYDEGLRPVLREILKQSLPHETC